jgi:hypothetical protein
MDAFDSALAILKDNGTYAELFADELNAGFLLIPLDCAADPSFFPFPERCPCTLLNRVLRRGFIRTFDVFILPGLDTLLDLMISIIGDHYGVPLTRVVVERNDSTTALEMVIDGQVDLAGPDFSLGGQFMGIARKRVFQESCIMLDRLGTFTVLDTSSFTDFASLASAPSLTTITNGQGTATTYSSVMPNLSVTLNDTISDDDIVAALRAGTINVLIDLDVNLLAGEGIDVTGLRTIVANFDEPNGLLFAIRCLKRNQCH